MHALEVAKTAWNAIVSGHDITGPNAKPLPPLNAVQWYLNVARHILTTLGLEGDEGGPLEQVDALHGLLKQETQ